MFRTPILAVTAIAAIGLAIPSIYSTAAFVSPVLAGSSYVPPSSGCGNSCGGGQPSNPSTPSDPGGGGGSGGNADPQDPGTPGGGNGPTGNYTPEAVDKAALVCNGALTGLHKLSAKTVAGFEGDANVVPVCNSGAGKQATIDGSQALPLQTTIAANPALMEALKAAGFDADSVVGVVMIKGQATLYVHAPVKG
jgi:hypothetical protein